jgi:hypothetical protein
VLTFVFCFLAAFCLVNGAFAVRALVQEGRERAAGATLMAVASFILGAAFLWGARHVR